MSAGKVLQSVLEQAVWSAVTRLKQCCTPKQFAALDQRLKLNSKKIKQLSIQPYFFVFQQLSKKQTHAQFVLGSILSILSNGYFCLSLYDTLCQILRIYLPDHSLTVIQIITKLQHPNIKILDLFLQIHSTIPIQQQQLKQLHIQSYIWLQKVFLLKRRPLNFLQSQLIHKIKPQQLFLITPQQQHNRLSSYLSLLLRQLVTKVQWQVQNIDPSHKGKYGFCMMCTSFADYYCKDSKVPVCGMNCKKQHLRLLTSTPILNTLFTTHQQQYQHLLLTSLQRKRSPSICADLLTCIYLYSNYKPKRELNHSAIMSLPLIEERIWLLYISRYNSLGLMFEHIFVGALEAQHQFVSKSAYSYFAQMTCSERLFQVCSNQDYRINNIINKVLRRVDLNRRYELINNIVNTVEWNKRQANIGENKMKILIKAFNSQMKYPSHLFELAFGENYLEESAKLLLKYQDQINKNKLLNAAMEDNNLLKCILNEIILPIKHAPFDQVLREVFYFLNTKVADEIYKLLQFICQIYGANEIFSKQTLYKYGYFILMLVTQIQIQPCNITLVFKRASDFFPQLATTHKSILLDMVQRISTFPFTTQKRGLRPYYPHLKRTYIPINYIPQTIISQNWQIILQTLQSMNDPTILYKSCKILLSLPLLCNKLLPLFLKYIDSTTVLHFFQILTLSPNSVCSMWGTVFQLLSKHPSSHTLPQIIDFTAALTDENYLFFLRQFLERFPLARNLSHYVRLLKLNLVRSKQTYPLLLPCVVRCTPYVQIRILMLVQGSAGLSFFLAVLKNIPVNAMTQHLLLCLFQTEVRTDDVLWDVIVDKCLDMQNRECEAVIARQNKAYEQYMLKKSLYMQNGDYLVQLPFQRVQQYLGSMSEGVLKKLLVEKNIKNIIKNWKYYQEINQFYQFLGMNIQNIEVEEGKILYLQLVKKIKNIQIKKLYNYMSFLIKITDKINKNISLIIKEFISGIQQKYDQKYYLNRIKHFALMIDQFEIIVSNKQRTDETIIQALQMIKIYCHKQGPIIQNNKSISFLKQQLRCIRLILKLKRSKSQDVLAYLASQEAYKQNNFHNDYSKLFIDQAFIAAKQKDSIVKPAHRIILDILLRGQYDSSSEVYMSWTGEAKQKLQYIVSYLIN